MSRIHNISTSIKLMALRVLTLVSVVILLVIFCVACVSELRGAKSLPRCPHTRAVVYGCTSHLDTLDVSSLKTGDLLAVCYGDGRTLFSKFAYNSIWSHVGLVYIDATSNEPFVFEIAGYSPPYNGSVVRTPLLTWARINYKTEAIVLVPINKAVPPSLIDAEFAKIEKEDIVVESFSLAWFRFLWRKSALEVSPESYFAHPLRQIPPVKRSARFHPFACLNSSQEVYKFDTGSLHDYPLTCHEVIIHILQKAKVFCNKLTPCSYLPNSLVERSIPTIGDYKYLTPLHVSVVPIVELCKV